MGKRVKHNPYDFLDFEKLLRPYKEAGTVERPRTRNISVILDFLLNRLHFPMEVVGATLLETFLELQAGKQFKGDGTYGSAGRELVQYMKMRAHARNQQIQTKSAELYALNLLKTLERARTRTLGDKLSNWMKTGYFL